jgi:hypothetical protein
VDRQACGYRGRTRDGGADGGRHVISTLPSRLCFPSVGSQQGHDFLAVIDAEPDSAASGMLFANDHDVSRTFIFDVNDPKHPKIVTSFTDMAGHSNPILS